MIKIYWGRVVAYAWQNTKNDLKNHLKIFSFGSITIMIVAIIIFGLIEGWTEALAKESFGSQLLVL